MKTKPCVAFLACLAISLPAGSVQSVEKSEQPPLDQSLQLSQKMEDPHRLSYLTELCSVSPHLNLPAEKVKEYSLSLFNLASKAQDAVGQKNAAACLSSVDPAAAMDLLLQINSQRQGGMVDEDPRYNAAEATFINFLAKFPSPQAANSIRERAKDLAKNGQYPYVAVAQVIKRLPASSKSEATNLLEAMNLLKDAVESYTNEVGFSNRDEEFLRFLQTLQNTAVRDDLGDAVAAFAERLTKEPIQVAGDFYAEVHVVSTGKVFPFVDRNEAFLFRAFPLIHQFKPTLAEKLRLQDSKLSEATAKTDDLRYVSGGFIQGNPTSEQAAQQHLQLLQRSLLRRIKEGQDSDPQAAFDLAQRLTDTKSRIVGFSIAAQGMVRKDAARAQSIYEEQFSALRNLDDSVDKLQATVALARTACLLGNSKDYESLSEQAFNMGVQLFSGDDKGQKVKGRKGFNEIQDLVTFTASQPRDILGANVRRLPEGELKTYLSLYEAVGNAKQNGSQIAAALHRPK